MITVDSSRNYIQIRVSSKMDDEGDAIENALNTVVITLEKSVKMKKTETNHP